MISRQTEKRESMESEMVTPSLRDLSLERRSSQLHINLRMFTRPILTSPAKFLLSHPALSIRSLPSSREPIKCTVFSENAFKNCTSIETAMRWWHVHIFLNGSIIYIPWSSLNCFANGLCKNIKWKRWESCYLLARTFHFWSWTSSNAFTAKRYQTWSVLWAISNSFLPQYPFNVYKLLLERAFKLLAPLETFFFFCRTSSNTFNERFSLPNP